MTERDPLDRLLREWEAPEPTPELDERVIGAYRKLENNSPPWRRFWQARISVPVPLLIAAAVIAVVVFWFRSPPAPSASPETPGVVTRLHATGFEPLPRGEAHIVPAKEMRQ